MNRTPFAILSAELETLTPAENGLRSYALADMLRASGLNHQQVTGRYNGTEEKSFLVLLPDGDTGPGYLAVLEMAENFQQESVLYVGADRVASLDYGPDFSDSKILGLWSSLAGPKYPDSYTETPDGTKYGAIPF